MSDNQKKQKEIRNLYLQMNLIFSSPEQKTDKPTSSPKKDVQSKTKEQKEKVLT